MSKKVAVVTGSNKGIGLAIIERLHNELKDKNFDIYLTSRNEENGQKALQELEKKGVKVCFHQLDITCEKSVERIACFLKEKYGGLDILVNNAGILTGDSTIPQAEQAEVILGTNFFKTLAFCEAMFPLLRPHARVVHLGSVMAVYGLEECSPEMRAKLTSPTSLDNLKTLMRRFVDAKKAGNLIEGCFPTSSYSVSKIAVTVMGIIQQRAFDEDAREDLVVNVADPGYVNTDMTSGKGPLSTSEGADTPCYLALLPAGTAIKGQHVAKREIVAWK